MRNAAVVLETIGDDPLTELQELDAIYGWSMRIRRLSSLFEKRKRSVVPYFLLFLLILTGTLCLAAAMTFAYVNYFS